MSGDLRAKVEGLPSFANYPETGDLIMRRHVLALIPEGAVLVTEDQIERALAATIANFWQPDGWDADELASDVRAYSLPYILRHLREGT